MSELTYDHGGKALLLKAVAYQGITGKNPGWYKKGMELTGDMQIEYLRTIMHAAYWGVVNGTFPPDIIDTLSERIGIPIAGPDVPGDFYYEETINWRE